MKTRVKTNKKTKKWHDHDYFVQKHPHSDAWINLMVFCRTLFMMRGLDKIVDDAVAYANDRGENVKKKSFPSHTAEGKLRQILRNTEKALKKKKGVPVMKEWGHHGPTIRLPKSGGGGCANPCYGMTVRQGGWCVIGTAIHEMTHIIHLVKVNEYRQNGKRRPHDICYNRIMLMVAKKLFKLTDKELSGHPKRHGYSIGNGYAPTRRGLDPAINKLLKDEDPRIMRFFTAEKPAEKKKKGPSRTAWIRTMEQWIQGEVAYMSDELWSGMHHEGQEAIDREEAGSRSWEITAKVRAGEVLSDRDLHLFKLLVKDCENELDWAELVGRSMTFVDGYRWWLENVQNAGGGV